MASNAWQQERRSYAKVPSWARRWGQRALITAACTALALTVAACSGSSGTQGAQQGTQQGTTSPSGPTGTLNVGISAAMNLLAPLPYGNGNYELYSVLYSTLVTLNGTSPVPALAKSWQLAADKKSLTLTLLPGLKFSDGTPIDASAIVWNVNWEKEPAPGSHALTAWKQVTASAVNTTTVKLTFSQPIPAIYAMLAGAPIVKPNAVNSGVASGAFKVTKFVAGTQLTMAANPNYFGPAPHVATIVFTNYTETSTAALALRSGTIDLLVMPASTQLDSLKSAGDQFLYAPASQDGYFPSVAFSLLVNSSQAPLNDPRVRQALSLAFDRSGFISTALSGMGDAAQSPFTQSSPAYRASPATASFDLNKAKALLQQAGAGHLTVKMDTVSILPQAVFMPIYQQDLAKIGVTLKINQIDPTTWATAINTGGYQMITQEGAFPDGDPAINFGNNEFGPSQHFSSPRFTTLLDTPASEADASQRSADYVALGQYLQQQMFYIPLVNARLVSAAYSPKVTGVQPLSYSFVDYAHLSVK